VRVNRNHFGRQVESFQAPLDLPFLKTNGISVPFPGVFIRAPVVERILPNMEGVQVEEQKRGDTVVAPSREVADRVARAAMGSEVEIIATLPGRAKMSGLRDVIAETSEEAGDIIAVRQGNVFGTSFHPELTRDARIHAWWLRQVEKAVRRRRQDSAFMWMF
jgi:pyridoxal 5'-phosphate synthase pdxT subunit